MTPSFFATGSIGTNPNGVLYSSDGVTWSVGAMTMPPGFLDTYFNGIRIAAARDKVVAVGYYFYAPSTDCQSFSATRVTLLTTIATIYGDSALWLMGGDGTTNSIALSTDNAETWVGAGKPIDTAASFEKLGSLWVAVGYGTTGPAAHSANGSTWSTGTGLAVDSSLWMSASDGSIVLAAGTDADGNALLAKTTDGQAWTTLSNPSFLSNAGYPRGLAFGAGKWWFAWSSNDTNYDHLAWSSDLSTWTDVGEIADFIDVVMLRGVGSRLFAGTEVRQPGASPGLAYSDNSGATWTHVTSSPETGQVIRGMAYMPSDAPPQGGSIPSPPGVDIWLGDVNGSGTPEMIVTPSRDWLLAGAEEAYKQSLRRRFITNPGEYKNKPNYGAGLSGAVKSPGTRSNRDGIAANLRQQALLDHRTRRVISVNVRQFATNGIEYDVVVEMRGGDGTPITVSDRVPGESFA